MDKGMAKTKARGRVSQQAQRNVLKDTLDRSISCVSTFTLYGFLWFLFTSVAAISFPYKMQQIPTEDISATHKSPSPHRYGNTIK